MCSCFKYSKQDECLGTGNCVLPGRMLGSFSFI